MSAGMSISMISTRESARLTAIAFTLARSSSSSRSVDGQLAAGRGLGGERGDLRGSQPLHQPLPAEIGDRGHEDEHLGEHDEQDGEQQQLGRQSRHDSGTAAVLRSYARSFVLHEHHS